MDPNLIRCERYMTSLSTSIGKSRRQHQETNQLLKFAGTRIGGSLTDDGDARAGHRAKVVVVAIVVTTWIAKIGGDFNGSTDG